MKVAIEVVSLALAIFLALVIQERIPPVDALYGARILLVPAIFCYGALALPGWAMLLLAAFTGLILDLMYLLIIHGQVEIGLGWSIVYFVLFGLFAHGFQPAFRRGKWWLHMLLSAVGTSLYLALQYAMICFRREGLVWNEIVLWRIVGPGLFASLVAMLVYLAAWQAQHFFPPSVEDYQGRR